MVELVEQKVFKVRVEDIVVYGKNARKHSEGQIKALAHSIEARGFRVPVRLNNEKEKVLVAGHGTLSACKLLGMTEVLAVYDDDLTPEEIKAWRIAHNKLAELSEWDGDLLIGEFQDLTDLGFDLDLTGFDELEIDGLKPSAESKEVVEDEISVNAYTRAKEKTKVQLGDVYKLGEHRLVCGDATKKSDVDKLINVKNVDMVFTDPPYGISIVNAKKQVVGDGLGDTHFKKKEGVIGVSGGFKRSKTVVLANKYPEIIGDDKPFDLGHLLGLAKRTIIFGANNFADKLPSQGHWLVWDKKTKSDGANYDNSGSFFGDAELLWTDVDRKSVKIYRHLWVGLLKEGSTVKRVHPTQKPVELLAQILSDYSEEGQIVLDPYGGSGSTLMACEQLSRKCFMMELDPVYCQIIIDRWEKFTGKKSLKVS